MNIGHDSLIKKKKNEIINFLYGSIQYLKYLHS